MKKFMRKILALLTGAVLVLGGLKLPVMAEESNGIVSGGDVLGGTDVSGSDASGGSNVSGGDGAGESGMPGGPGGMPGGPGGASSSADPIEGDIIDVVLNVGATENAVNVTWYTTSSAAKLQLAHKSDCENGAFPEGACTEYVANTIVSGYVASYEEDGSNDVVYYSNSVSLTGLLPGTEYVYRVSGLDANNNEIWSGLYNYTVRNVSNGYSFLVVGDPQIGSGSVDSDTAGWQNTMAQALSALPNASFLLSVGDQINSARNNDNQAEQNFKGFLSENSLLATLPVATSVGNHDNSHAQAYSSHYTLPNVSSYGSTSDEVSGEEDYYFTYGNTLFIMLNTNNSSIAEHKAFIEQTIVANSDCIWRVVAFHQSIYSVAKHVNDGNIAELREGLSPVFYENEIDVVLMGHDHVYARSYIMGGASGAEAVISTNENGSALTEITDAEGVQYVTFNSGSGSKYYSITSELYTYTAVQNQENVPNYSCVTVDNDSFTISTYRSTDNSLVDTITLVKTNVSNNTSGKTNSTYAAPVEVQEDWNAISTEVTEKISVTGGQVDVIVGNEVVVPAAVVGQVYGTNGVVALHTGNGVAFSISGVNVTASAVSKDLNLSIEADYSKLNAVEKEKAEGAVLAKRISMVSHENYNMVVNMHLALEKTNADRYANLYVYDAINNALMYKGSFKITGEGQAMFGITGGEEYLVTVTDERPEEVIVTNYVVASGDTLSYIATKYGMKLQALVALNPDIYDINKIKVGQIITVQ